MNDIDHTWYERPLEVPEHTSAGGIVARREDDRVTIALGTQDGYTDFVLPKGHVDPGEDLMQAAVREIEEEAGFTDLQFMCELGHCERLDFRKEAWKITHYFLFLTRQIQVQPTESDRHDPPSWFDLDSLPDMVWPEQRKLIVHNREQIRRHILAVAPGG